MKFINEITIDWYDNILKSFCTDGNNNIYYCCVLAIDEVTNQKVYLCVNLKYLKGYVELKPIIKEKSFKLNWNKLPSLIELNKENESYLIKTNDLRGDKMKFTKYKKNVDLPSNIIWGEYPEFLEEAGKIDDWWRY
jgi:hypothetical protein